MNGGFPLLPPADQIRGLIKNNVRRLSLNQDLFNHTDVLAKGRDVTVSSTMIKVTYNKGAIGMPKPLSGLSNGVINRRNTIHFENDINSCLSAPVQNIVKTSKKILSTSNFNGTADPSEGNNVGKGNKPITPKPISPKSTSLKPQLITPKPETPVLEKKKIIKKNNREKQRILPSRRSRTSDILENGNVNSVNDKTKKDVGSELVGVHTLNGSLDTTHSIVINNSSIDAKLARPKTPVAAGNEIVKIENKQIIQEMIKNRILEEPIFQESLVDLNNSLDSSRNEAEVVSPKKNTITSDVKKVARMSLKRKSKEAVDNESIKKPKVGIKSGKEEKPKGSQINGNSDKEILEIDPNLPPGWSRSISIRPGDNLTKVNITSPHGRKFGSKCKLKQFLASTNSPYDIHEFYFGLYKQMDDKNSGQKKKNSIIAKSGNVADKVEQLQKLKDKTIPKSKSVTTKESPKNTPEKGVKKPLEKTAKVSGNSGKESKTILNSPAKNKVSKNLMLFDPNLPDGWKRLIDVKHNGEPTGRIEVLIVSPEGKKFRRRQNLARYLLEMKLPLKPEKFYFGLYQQAEPGTPKKKSNINNAKIMEKTPLKNKSSIEAKQKKKQENLKILKLTKPQSKIKGLKTKKTTIKNKLQEKMKKARAKKTTFLKQKKSGSIVKGKTKKKVEGKRTEKSKKPKPKTPTKSPAKSPAKSSSAKPPTRSIAKSPAKSPTRSIAKSAAKSSSAKSPTISLAKSPAKSQTKAPTKEPKNKLVKNVKRNLSENDSKTDCHETKEMLLILKKVDEESNVNNTKEWKRFVTDNFDSAGQKNSSPTKRKAQKARKGKRSEMESSSDECSPSKKLKKDFMQSPCRSEAEKEDTHCDGDFVDENGISQLSCPPMLIDPNLPDGWSRKIKVRRAGDSAGRMEVFIVSPDGRKHRYRGALRDYIERNGLNLDADNFDFTVYGKNCGSGPGKVSRTKSIQRDFPNSVPDEEPTPSTESLMINSVSGLMVSSGLSSPRSERRQKIPKEVHEKNLKEYLNEPEVEKKDDNSAIPVQWIHTLVKCRSDSGSLDENAASSIASATEQFLKDFVVRAFERTDNATNSLEYDDLASLVNSSEHLSRLRPFIPKKITYKEFVRLNRPQNYSSFT